MADVLVDMQAQSVSVEFAGVAAGPYLTLDQTTPQIISNGVPRLAEDRSIDHLNALTDRQYVDEAVASLAARYYMLDDDDPTGYKLTSQTASGEATATYSKSNLSDDDYIMGWIQPEGDDLNKLIAGVYAVRVFAEKTAGTQTLRLYWKLVERKADESEVVLATSNESDEIDAKSLHIISAMLTSDHQLEEGSRVVGKIYAAVSGSGNAPAVTIYYEGNEDSAWQIPVNLEIIDGRFLKLDQSTPQTISGGAPVFGNGLTANGDITGTVGVFDTLVDTPLLQPSGGDQIIKLGDNAGVNLFAIQNSDETPVYSVDSSGGSTLTNKMILDLPSGYTDNAIEVRVNNKTLFIIDIYNNDISIVQAQAFNVAGGTAYTGSYTTGDGGGFGFNATNRLVPFSGADNAALWLQFPQQGRAWILRAQTSGDSWDRFKMLSDADESDSGVIDIIKFAPAVNQSGTAGYNAFVLDITRDAVGSGTKNLMKLAADGVAKFVVSEDGDTTIAGAFDHDGATVGFFGVMPATQQAHIADADGTLADITAKFNTLLSYLENYGLLAAA